MGRKGIFEFLYAHLPRGKGLKSYNGYFIIWANFVIISRVSKGKGQQALFLQICFCSKIYNKLNDKVT